MVAAPLTRTSSGLSDQNTFRSTEDDNGRDELSASRTVPVKLNLNPAVITVGKIASMDVPTWIVISDKVELPSHLPASVVTKVSERSSAITARSAYFPGAIPSGVNGKIAYPVAFERTVPSDTLAPFQSKIYSILAEEILLPSAISSTKTMRSID